MICAIQEQAITTRYIQWKIHHTTDNDRCWLCRQAAETIHHIMSGCIVMAPTKYLQRHNNVCTYVHGLLLNEFDFKENQTAWYQHQPWTVKENANPKILWNFTVQTDHALQQTWHHCNQQNKQQSTHYRCSCAERQQAYSNLAVEIRFNSYTWHRQIYKL